MLIVTQNISWRLYVRCSCKVTDTFCWILIKFGFSRQIFISVPSIKFYANSAGGSRTDTCGRTVTEMDGRS